MTESEELTRLVQRLEAEKEALDLELERAHRLLDTWGVPREIPDPHQPGRPLELSLSGRLELLEDSEE